MIEFIFRAAVNDVPAGRKHFTVSHLLFCHLGKSNDIRLGGKVLVNIGGNNVVLFRHLDVLLESIPTVLCVSTSEVQPVIHDFNP